MDPVVVFRNFRASGSRYGSPVWIAVRLRQSLDLGSRSIDQVAASQEGQILKLMGTEHDNIEVGDELKVRTE